MAPKRRSFRARALLIVIALLQCVSLIGCSRTEYWREEVALHDGRVVEVERSVVFKHGRGELTEVFRKSPTQYAISTIHPDAGEKVSWLGEDHINPIMLDFVNGSAYVVALPWSIYVDKRKYNCPNPPYIFFRYGREGKRWELVRREEAPRVLRRANLSAVYDGTYMKDGVRQKKEDINERNKLAENRTGGFFQSVFPTDLATWSYQYKNEKHPRDECPRA